MPFFFVQIRVHWFVLQQVAAANVCLHKTVTHRPPTVLHAPLSFFSLFHSCHAGRARRRNIRSDPASVTRVIFSNLTHWESRLSRSSFLKLRGNKRKWANTGCSCVKLTSLVCVNVHDSCSYEPMTVFYLQIWHQRITSAGERGEMVCVCFRCMCALIREWTAAPGGGGWVSLGLKRKWLVTKAHIRT